MQLVAFIKDEAGEDAILERKTVVLGRNSAIGARVEHMQILIQVAKLYQVLKSIAMFPAS